MSLLSNKNECKASSKFYGWLQNEIWICSLQLEPKRKLSFPLSRLLWRGNFRSEAVQSKNHKLRLKLFRQKSFLGSAGFRGNSGKSLLTNGSAHLKDSQLFHRRNSQTSLHSPGRQLVAQSSLEGSLYPASKPLRHLRQLSDKSAEWIPIELINLVGNCFYRITQIEKARTRRKNL